MAIAGLNGDVAGGILAIVDFVGSVARLIVKEMIVRIAAGGGDGLGGAFDGRAQFGGIVERRSDRRFYTGGDRAGRGIAGQGWRRRRSSRFSGIASGRHHPDR